jgi:ABC-type Fe3+-hydroxamate transport system substrate-binding protein
MFKKCIVFALTIAMTASFAACTQPETITTTVPGATSTITKTTTVPGETVTTTVSDGNVTQTVTHSVTTTVTKTVTAEPESLIFTDSLGRLVEVPSNITKVAMSGPLTQIVLFPLCPDKLVGLATTWSAEAEEFIPTEYYNLPILGALYGGEDLKLRKL